MNTKFQTAGCVLGSASLKVSSPWRDVLLHAVQLEEELQDNLKWSMLTESILHVEKSKFQDVELVQTGPFGKVSAVADVWWCIALSCAGTPGATSRSVPTRLDHRSSSSMGSCKALRLMSMFIMSC